jgi:hypothetical protein
MRIVDEFILPPLSPLPNGDSSMLSMILLLLLLLLYCSYCCRA